VLASVKVQSIGCSVLQPSCITMHDATDDKFRWHNKAAYGKLVADAWHAVQHGGLETADYLKPELTAETQPQPDFSDFLDKVRRGQAAVGKEHAVPVVLGARLFPCDLELLESLSCRLYSP
jgi:hypothetical protein